jgi:probable selenium-dependent hydroxylase accessory protein YqeC
LFSHHFAFRKHALINFVGGGGKTILIHKLMEEYSPQGTVLCTTTTRIHPPDPSEGLVVISSEQLSLLRLLVDEVGRSCQDSPYKIVITRGYMTPNLLRGIPPDFVSGLDKTMFPVILNEADGAASFSLKIPRTGEPVLMEKAEYLVPVIGLDCLHKTLGPQVLFRFHSLAESFSLQAGAPLTPELAANILMHRQGVCKDWQSGVTIVPFINKVDDPSQDSLAINLATLILKNGNFPVNHVVYGSVANGRVDSISTPIS